MASKDVKDISQDAEVSQSKRKFDQSDFDTIAEMVIDTYEKRKREREHLEKHWKDIDRQVAMEPDVKFKTLPDGKIDVKKHWMSEIELPLQAQALEVLRADARRLMIPDGLKFFRAHGMMTDKYLENVNFESLIYGDETEVPSHINQDNIDKLVEGFLIHQFNQTDFASRLDRINAEAFKYGMGVGRARMETKSVYIHEAKGTRKEKQELPVLVPCSIKNLYLDDPKPSMHSAQVLGDAHIAVDWMKYENLAMASNKGSTDPDDPDGGWMPKALKKLEPDGDGYVQLLEMEGDIVVPRKTVRSMVLPGCIVTVAIGGSQKGGDVTRGVIRLRFRKYPFSSYLLFPYQYESADACYPTSPLMKGRPVQIMATEAANRMLDSAMLKIAPPVGYDKSDMEFAASGGPRIAPYEFWQSIDPNAIKVWTEIGGDPSTMGAMLTNAVQFYSNLTGVLPGRLGAQTISHTTAFAKGAELQQGAARTVAYVSSSGNGPILRWLDMAYVMGRDSIKGKIHFFVEPYGGFLEVSRDQLPEEVAFDWLGSGGPQDENQKMQNMVNGLLLAGKMDQLNVQMGKPPRIDYDKAIDQVLRQTGWTDLDAITNRTSDSATLTQQAGPGPAVAAIQNLTAQQPE